MDDSINTILDNQMLEPVSHFEYLGKAFTNHNDNSAILQRIYFTQTAYNRKKLPRSSMRASMRLIRNPLIT